MKTFFRECLSIPAARRPALAWLVLALFICAAASPTFAATNDLTSALQRGLFEEEANQNLPAAIQAYQSVIEKFDKDRKLVATAIFRLGECYRKQGRTNEASAQYERVLTEFREQTALVNLSRQYVARTGTTATETKSDSGLAEQIESAEIARLSRLLAESPDLVTAKTEGKTRLHEAVSKGQLRVAEFLLKNGAEVDATGPNYNYTPLQNAVSGGNRAMVELLLKHGAKVNGIDRSESPLHLAALKGYRNVAELLLEKGADVNARNSLQLTPLHRAALNGFKSITELLIQKGAEIDAYGSEPSYNPGSNPFSGTPLHAAVGQGHEAVVSLLLTANPDLQKGNGEGDTPLHLAAQKGHAQIAEMLIKAGAKVDAGKQRTENLRGWTALHDACEQGHSTMASLLLKHGANPNGTGDVSTPLQLAVHKGHLDTVRVLLQFKADPNLYKGDRNLLASALPNPAVLRSLLEAGANPDLRSAENNTPLMEAAARPLPEATRVLLQFKADPNARGEDGLTPLHCALSRPATAKQDPALEVVKTLVAAGADVNALTTAGITPLRYALDWGTESFRTVLKGAGAQLYAPNFQAIGLTRASLEQPLITFRKDSTGWNRYTALEAMYYYYTGSAESSGSVAQPYPIPPRSLRVPGTPGPLPLGVPYRAATPVMSISQGGQFPFPDISGIQIRRPRSGKPGDEELIPLNLSTNIDCTKDVVLRFGDLLDIPERVHSLAEQPMGLDRVQESALKECLERKVCVKTLSRENAGKEVEVTIMPSYLSQVMRMDEVRRVLSSSSDLSRVKVKSTDPLTKQSRETLIDVQVVTNGRQPIHEDIWLRDGDIVEVPER